MATQASLEQIEFAVLTLVVDEARVAVGPFKLFIPLRTALSAALDNAALDLLTILNSRVRFFYWAASNDLDQTPELARIGRQPRRNAGDAAAAPKPGAAGTATFDATALTLTLPAMPDHATTLRAIHQPAGGVAEVCGTSTTTTVSVIDLSPLTPASPTNSGSSATTPKATARKAITSRMSRCRSSEDKVHTLQ